MIRKATIIHKRAIHRVVGRWWSATDARYLNSLVRGINITVRSHGRSEVRNRYRISLLSPGGGHPCAYLEVEELVLHVPGALEHLDAVHQDERDDLERLHRVVLLLLVADEGALFRVHDVVALAERPDPVAVLGADALDDGRLVERPDDSGVLARSELIERVPDEARVVVALLLLFALLVLARGNLRRFLLLQLAGLQLRPLRLLELGLLQLYVPLYDVLALLLDARIQTVDTSLVENALVEYG